MTRWSARGPLPRSSHLLQAALALSRERDEDGVLARILDAALTVTDAR
jgi:hypothetical protein